jgi:hypothetical protein
MVIVNNKEQMMFEIVDAVRDMKAAGLSNGEIALEFFAALMIFVVPIMMMFL